MVRFKGEEDGIITFRSHKSAGISDVGEYGIIDKYGHINVKMGSGKGLIPGEYDVTVVLLKAEDENIAVTSTEVKFNGVIPECYASIKISGLSVTVPERKCNMEFTS